MNSQDYIYHVCHKSSLNPSEQDYTHPSLSEEGFIHCSTQTQVEGVIERYFKNEDNLVILQIDPSQLISELKYEASTNQESFPHVYGPLNASSIVNILKIDE